MLNFRSYFSVLLLFLVGINSSAQNYMGEEGEIKSILCNIENFSKFVMESDYERIGNSYTTNAKIFPNNKAIISGKDEITSYWQSAVASKISYHKILPEEIKIIGDEAYDYGYYEGKSFNTNGKEVDWKGKYVIVWKKLDNDWKIYLDIWNRVAD